MCAFGPVSNTASYNVVDTFNSSGTRGLAALALKSGKTNVQGASAGNYGLFAGGQVSGTAYTNLSATVDTYFYANKAYFYS